MQTPQAAPPVPGDANDYLALSQTRVNVGPVERVVSGLAGGALLAYAAIHRRMLTDLPMGLAGGYLIYRAVGGYCPISARIGRDSAHPKAIVIDERVVVNQPVDEVYAFWRELENLPQFMKHLSKVTQLDGRRSHWEASVPGGFATVSWDATIVEERENELLSWQSDADATVNNSGIVAFRSLGPDRTEVHAILKYLPPAGELGKGVASLLNPALAKLVKADLRRFQKFLDGGEMDASSGNPSDGGRVRAAWM